MGKAANLVKHQGVLFWSTSIHCELWQNCLSLLFDSKLMLCLFMNHIFLQNQIFLVSWTIASWDLLLPVCTCPPAAGLCLCPSFWPFWQPLLWCNTCCCVWSSWLLLLHSSCCSTTLIWWILHQYCSLHWKWCTGWWVGHHLPFQ
jgi:hypothetical protein